MKYGVRAAKYIAISGMLVAAGVAACSSDDSNTLQGGSDAGNTTNPDSGSGSQGDSGTVVGNNDSGVVVGDNDSGSTTQDAGTDSNVTTVADSGTDSAVATFCQGQTGLDFCQDFDEASPLSLDGGASTTWTSILSNLIPDAGSELAVSAAQAASAPDSLHVTLPLGAILPDQSAKVVKVITPANGVTQAIYEFDMFIDQIPNSGGFATDFQFLAGDSFGFRIGVFGAADGGFDHADLEHNHPTLGGNDDITSPIAITPHAWNHVKMTVAYSALADDAGDSVAFSLYLNKSATPAVNANYPAPFAKALYASFAAGMVYAFDAQNKNWGIYYDNFTLKLQ